MNHDFADKGPGAAQPSTYAPSAALGGTKGVWYMVLVLATVQATASLDQIVLLILMQGIKTSLNLSDMQVSLIDGAAFALFYAVSVIVCGRLADRVNRRNMLLIGMIGWNVAMIFAGFSQSFAQLALARIAIGIAQGTLITTTVAIISDRAPPELRGRGVTLLFSGSTLGGAAASFLGGGLLHLFSLRDVGQLLFGVTFAPWQLVLMICGGIGLALAPLLLTVEEPARSVSAQQEPFRILPYLMQNRRSFVPLLACSACFIMAILAISGWGSILLFRNVGMSPITVGVTLGFTSLGGAILAAPLGGWLSDGFVKRDPQKGRMTLLIILLPIAALSALMLVVVAVPFIVILGFTLIGVTATIVSSLLITILSELVPSDGRGRIASLFGLVSIVCGMGIAPTLVATVTDHIFHDESKLPLSLVVVSVPAIIVATILAVRSLPHVCALRADVLSQAR